MVIKSIKFVLAGLPPPPIATRVDDDNAVRYTFAANKSPKSSAFPVVAMVMNSIVLVSIGTDQPIIYMLWKKQCKSFNS